MSIGTVTTLRNTCNEFRRKFCDRGPATIRQCPGATEDWTGRPEFRVPFGVYGLACLPRETTHTKPPHEARRFGVYENSGETRESVHAKGAPRSPGRPVQSCVAPGHWRMLPAPTRTNNNPNCGPITTLVRSAHLVRCSTRLSGGVKKKLRGGPPRPGLLKRGVTYTRRRPSM